MYELHVSKRFPVRKFWVYFRVNFQVYFRLQKKLLISGPELQLPVTTFQLRKISPVGIPPAFHLSSAEDLDDELHQEVGPDDMQDEEQCEQPIENVVRGEHLNDLRRLNCRAAQFYDLNHTKSGNTSFIRN